MANPPLLQSAQPSPAAIAASQYTGKTLYPNASPAGIAAAQVVGYTGSNGQPLPAPYDHSAPAQAPAWSTTSPALPQQPFSQPNTSFTGDLSQPGAAEQYFGQNQGQFNAPNALSQYWGGVSGQFANPQGNNANQAYQQFQASQPQDMSSYYDNAVSSTNADLSKQAAAQGLSGSSAAMGQIATADQTLRGQEAQANAQYGLQRGQLGGQLAGQADQSTAQTLGLGGQLAGNTASQGLQGLTAGMGAASNAEQALQQRQGQYINQLMGYAGGTTGAGTAIGGADVNSQDQLLNNYLESLVAGPSQAVQMQNQSGGAGGGSYGQLGSGIGTVLGSILGSFGGPAGTVAGGALGGAAGGAIGGQVPQG